MRYEGFKSALLSAHRQRLITERAEPFLAVGSLNLTVLLTRGREDRTVPFEHHRKVLPVIPRASFHPIDQAGHVPHLEQAERVNHILVRFLKGG